MTVELLLREFDSIAGAPDAVTRLRRFILDLAVRGRLSTSDANDTPAIVTLGARAIERSSLVPAWSLPPTWEWTSFARLGTIQGGGTPNKENEEYWKGDIPWVTPKDMKVDYIEDTIDHISLHAVHQSSAKILPTGTLLMVVRGMILSHSFPVALTQTSVTVNQDMKALVPFLSEIAPMLLVIGKGMRSPVLDLVEHSTHGTCRLPTDLLLTLPLPFPPLEEQSRIVETVDALMTVCDSLELAQRKRDAIRANFLDTVLADALN